MFELFSICFIALPLEAEVKTELALNMSKVVAYEANRKDEDQCTLHTTGGTFVIPWSCQRVTDRYKAECS